jgi:hypothetical protein
MTSQQALISTLIADSEKLISYAEASDWEAFSALESHRQSQLETLDLRNENLTEPAHSQVQIKMKQLIQLNETLGNICREQRSEAMAELQKITVGNKAKKAYS